MGPREIYSLFAFGAGAKGFLRFSLPVCAYAYYRYKRENLLTGAIEKFSCQKLQEHLNQELLGEKSSLIQVWHFFYEWGHFYQGAEERIGDEQVLVIELRFTKATPWHLQYGPNRPTALKLQLEKTISYGQYLALFQRGYEQLLAGNCYQFNLTHLFSDRCQGPLGFAEFCRLLWSANVAPFAHGTFIPAWDKSIVSNSPEMLFQVGKRADTFTIHSMPIKGSIPLETGAKWQQSWRKLRNSPKDGAELDMITDLLRNDLTRIEQRYCQVVAQKRPLKVPKILHQYSHLAAEISPQVGAGTVLAALFPGGSITGAPKKKVMEILQSLEQSPRGIYTGSTMLRWQHINVASINIRTALLHHQGRKIEYGAGGGITLLSRPRDEFAEMHLKRESFFSSLQ